MYWSKKSKKPCNVIEYRFSRPVTAPDIKVVSITLPWLELVIGLCLLIDIWLPGASVSGSGLLTAFIVVLIYNQVRGVDISCGCFTTEVSSETAGIGTVLRDVGFLAMSLVLTVMILFPRTEK